MAALEVVKRRLDAVGLGDACLELHSHKTSKKAVLDELRRTLGLGRPRLGAGRGRPADARRDARPAQRLLRGGQHAGRPERRHAAPGVSASCSGSAAELDERHAAAARDPRDAVGWTGFDFKRRRAARRAAPGAAGRRWASRASTRSGAAGATVLLPTEWDRLRDRSCWPRRTTTAVLREAAGAARRVPPPAAGRRPGGSSRPSSARRDGPRRPSQVHGADVRSEDWLARRRRPRGAARRRARPWPSSARRYDAMLLPEAWDQDLLEARHDLNAYGRRWWRLPLGRLPPGAASSSPRSAAREPPRDLDDQLALIDAVLEARRHREVVRRHEPLAARLFGPRWQGERSHWEALAELAEWVRQLHHDVRPDGSREGLLDFLAERPGRRGLAPLARGGRGRPSPPPRRPAAARRVPRIRRRRHGSAAPGGSTTSPLDEQEALLATSGRAGSTSCQALVAFNHLAGALPRGGAGGPSSRSPSRGPRRAGTSSAVFLAHWFEGLLKQGFRERPALAGFDGPGHEHVIRAFRELDRQALRPQPRPARPRALAAAPAARGRRASSASCGASSRRRPGTCPSASSWQGRATRSRRSSRCS